MRELGYVEGRTLQTEYLYADGHFDRLPDLAAKLVEHKVDLIVTASTPAIIAAKRATDLSGKRLELLHTLVPELSHIAVLWDSSNPGMALRVRETRAAAEKSKIAFFDAGARNLDELAAMFAELLKRKPLALVVTAEPFTMEHRSRIVEFMAGSGIPAMYEEGRFVEAGGLMSYGPSVPDLFRRSANYVDKILKGTNPANLPIERPTKFELMINLKTAKALGVTVPATLLATAEKVIE
jgi:putative ABC transport system substrate-binding protein